MEYEEFGRKVKQAFEDSKRRYGAVKLCRVLNAAGTPCSIKRVQRHMAEQGLRSVVVKKYSHHANYGSIPDDKVNILKRDFETETINQKWCTDITYIHVQKEGWTYLASVMDLCSRKIIGYAYGTSMTAELAVKARMKTIVFILVIAALVQMVEIILKKMSPSLYQALGIFLPLITTNCAVLGVAILMIQKEFSLLQSVVYSISTALGFALALVIFAGIRERLDFEDVPKAFRGVPIALVSAGILAMAFMGFSGLV